ncbi:MAG TPA: CheR family methyltransferase [Dehalococcoidia bacterium]|nr:CheR family methyltransferase [Dehalococcoidia bacterium]
MTGKDTTHEFEALLGYLKRSRGFDFSGYKRATLMRRIRKQMQSVGVDDFDAYVDYLEVHPEEFGALFNGILINVTTFFRDPPAWTYVADEIVPRLLLSKRPEEPIRVWSAGCASGEEPYTIAMLLVEAMGVEAFRERVKLYATDIDEDALTRARQGTYSLREVGNIPAPLLERYFDEAKGRYTFRKDLRRCVIFGRHDLIQDAPISRVDLLSCRNVLMYFNAETQARVLARFHFALGEGGVLFLGKAEMLLTHAHTFSPIDLKRRVFIKASKGNLRDRLLLVVRGAGNEETVETLVRQVRLREAAFEAGSVAQMVVDTEGRLVLANEHARGLFGIASRDVGRPLQDLEVSYRPVELRSRIEQAHAERKPFLMRDVEWSRGESGIAYYDIELVPLYDNGSTLGVTISFVDVTRYKRLQEELLHSSQELETAYEELQSTNEELETTNEELQSTVEELETTNEELQSTNEELETMNEELQSTNEELQTINDELRLRSEERNSVNAFLESILASLRSGVAVANRDLMVQIWNGRAEDLWGLRQDEVLGKNLLNLDIGLPLERLRRPLRACLAGELPQHTETLEAISRRGRSIHCLLSIAPLVGSEQEIRGVILLMDESDAPGVSPGDQDEAPRR